MKRNSIFNPDISFVTYLSVPLLTYKTGCMMSVFTPKKKKNACVKERHWHPKIDEGKERKNEGERMRQRERGREREKKRKRECVGLHIIITRVHVRERFIYSVFTKDTLDVQRVLKDFR